jgi:GR25 family glycosyltransferase involved in LPS biosynthesis
MGQGGLGCVLSHIKVLQMAKKLMLPYVLILEDDVELVKDFDNKLQLCLNELPDKWDIFYLSGTPARPTKFYSKHLNRSFGHWGTFGYLVNSSVYDIILNEWEKLQHTADAALIKISAAMNNYVAANKLILHRDGYSYITNSHRKIKHLSE